MSSQCNIKYRSCYITLQRKIKEKFGKILKGKKLKEYEWKRNFYSFCCNIRKTFTTQVKGRPHQFSDNCFLFNQIKRPQLLCVSFLFKNCTISVSYCLVFFYCVLQFMNNDVSVYIFFIYAFLNIFVHSFITQQVQSNILISSTSQLHRLSSLKISFYDVALVPKCANVCNCFLQQLREVYERISMIFLISTIDEISWGLYSIQNRPQKNMLLPVGVSSLSTIDPQFI